MKISSTINLSPLTDQFEECLVSDLKFKNNFRCFDRFDIIEKPLFFEKLNHPFLEEDFNLNFRILCLKRIKEIINLAVSKNINKIYLFYSGGVDSTCIFSAYEILSKEEKHNVKLCILYTKESVLEYPYAFEYFQKNSIEIEEFKQNSIQVIEKHKNDILLLGEFGLSHRPWATRLPSICWNMPWENYIWNYLSNIDKTKKSLIIDFLRVYQEKVKTQIKYFCELPWFLSYFFSWSDALMNITYFASDIKSDIILFYNTLDFEQWDYTNRYKIPLLNMHNSEVYKIDLKNIIFEVFKDYNYFKYKNSVSSWHMTKEQMSLVGFVSNSKKYVFKINEKDLSDPRKIEEFKKWWLSFNITDKVPLLPKRFNEQQYFNGIFNWNRS